jgi:predicted GNAT superfamily acetyltransferase
MGKLKIRKAQPEDLPHIKQIAELNSLQNLSQKEAKKQGFLVSGFKTEEYEDFINRVDHFYVLTIDENIEAFLLAYSSQHIKPYEELNLHIKNNHCSDFILSKQIGVNPPKMSQGLATKLYNHLFSLTAPLPTYTVTVMKPINKRSNRFHEHIGFQKKFKYMPPDGKKRLIWKR